MEVDKETNGSTPRRKEKTFHLRPVAPDESGEGLPYAPVDWPKPGDTWKWRVGRRVAITGHYLDRYLYPPIRFLRRPVNSSKKRPGFASKLAVERFIMSTFPNADAKAFFASFSWKIPAKKAAINGRSYFCVHAKETAEHSVVDSQSDGEGVVCKAGNKMCSSLVVPEEMPLAVMPCDICCTEPSFCRECCCILCCKSISPDNGGYSYVKCEAVVSDYEDYICGHVAHINCALRTYLAGTVGGSIGLDAEYYCRRCDARTDLVPHVTTFLQTCESIDSREKIEEILNVGICTLRGSQKSDALGLLNRIETVLKKLKCGTTLKNILKVEDVSGETPDGTPDGTNSEDVLDNRTSSQEEASMSSDFQAESLKLDYEIDRVLHALRMAQESEYRLAEEQLHAQKEYIQSLYQELDKEKTELGCCTSSTNSDALPSAISDRVNQIKQEVMKLKNMEEVANGFGRTPKLILKEHFGLEIE